MSEHYQSKSLCRIRTITTFLSLGKNREGWEASIKKAVDFCHSLSNSFSENGYEVQSIRIVSNAFGEYLRTDSLENAGADLAYLSELLNTNQQPGLRMRFAIGEAKTQAEIALLPRLIQSYGDLCNACVNIPRDAHGMLDNHLIEAAALAVDEIARITPRGEGNFNFTVNFNCAPLIPYFPASYHDSNLDNCYVIGLETPDLLVESLKECNATLSSSNHSQRYHAYFDAMSTALNYHTTAVAEILNQFGEQTEFSFAGLDSSAAPSKNCASMVEVYQQMGVPYFGACGSVEASELLTRVFKSVKPLKLTGFSGLMLALTEDTGLAAGTVKGEFDIRALLTYSAVCGIGLDTVPIPGDTPIEKVSALMRDTGTMAFRLNKPLTVRLFPVPGLAAGEMTAFESDDLCNCAVLAVP